MEDKFTTTLEAIGIISLVAIAIIGVAGLGFFIYSLVIERK